VSEEGHRQEDAQQHEQQVDESEQSASSAVETTDDQYQPMRLSNRELPSPPSVYDVMAT